MTIKLELYHESLHVMLNELKELQLDDHSMDGHRIYVHGKGFVQVHFEIAFVIGDTDGHDAMCCHYTGHSANIERHCRDCDVSTEDCDDPDYQCTFNKQTDIQFVVEEVLFNVSNQIGFSGF